MPAQISMPQIGPMTLTLSWVLTLVNVENWYTQDKGPITRKKESVSQKNNEISAKAHEEVAVKWSKSKEKAIW